MKHIDGLLMAALLLVACSPGEQAEDESTGGVASPDSVHAGHDMAADSGSATHAEHDSAEATHGAHDGNDADAAHDGHAVSEAGHDEHAPSPSANHGGHAAAGQAGARAGAVSHAGHAAPASSADHAMHAPAASGQHSAHAGAEERHAEHEPAAEHAAHDADAPSEAHVGHMPDSAGQQAHAGHVPDSADHQDAAHAGHATDSTDTSHAAHDDAAPGAAHATHVMEVGDTSHVMEHEMAMFDLGRTGWMAIGMAQVFPTFSMAFPAEDDTPLAQTGFYATQPAIMLNLESPQSRVSLRTTLNFEGLTQPDGELTFGGWGEGFIDKRHPHTLLHEAMLSVNVWARDGGGFSLSAGKGFAPYGTDDPMSRPVVKYPTNHHLSQILERFTLNGVYSSPRWSVEVGVFGGNEPTSPYDFSNAESFANSWSTRVTRRFGRGAMGIWDWELGGSYGYVVEEHDGEEDVTQLYNAALRHEKDHSFGRLYSLIEASLSDPEHHAGYFSVLGEARVDRGSHSPYGRIEYATRPEYPREGEPGTDDFFRYDHDDEPLGSTRWLIVTAGYGFTATSLPFSVRPYVELQWNRVAADEGDVDPEALFGRSSYFGLSVGARVFLGGEPMRMGSYGVLDSMTLMHRMQMEMAAEPGTGPAAHDAHSTH